MIHFVSRELIFKFVRRYRVRFIYAFSNELCFMNDCVKGRYGIRDK